MKTTQCDRILRHLREIGPITQADAIREYGCFRLAARIADLRKAGHVINKRTKTSENRYKESVSFAEYYIEEENDA